MKKSIGVVILAFLLLGFSYGLYRMRDGADITVQNEASEKSQHNQSLTKINLTSAISNAYRGTASRASEDNLFSLSITALLPEGGVTPAAWLHRKNPEHWAEVGTLAQSAAGSFSVLFQSDIDFTDHDEVIITRENVSVTPREEEIILRGSFSP